ncbi:MAG: FIST N-terminal domain-containing protein [Rhodocyclaceae bacterium]
MLIRFDPAGHTAVLSGILADLAEKPEVGLVVVLAGDANGFTPAILDPTLRAFPKPLIGGVFPQVILGRDRFERGTVVVGLECRATVGVVAGISDPLASLSARTDAALSGSVPRGGTLLAFVDGRARRLGALTDSLFNAFGLDTDYLGGGAGSLDQDQRPCVFTNEGLLVDAAVLALTDIGAGVGVAHGWEPISGPFKVTASDRNTIFSLDWRPAFEVYRDAVATHANCSFAAADFSDLAGAYPFGIAKLDNEMVARSAHSQDGDALVCVGEVPQGSYVHILHGTPAGLTRAAGRACEIARSAYRRDRSPRGMLFIDCISRALFLGDDFSDELAAVDLGLPVVGALVLGEIANSGRDYLEFHNKTSVVGLLDA